MTEFISATIGFSDVTYAAGFGATIVGNTGSAAWGDFNGDGLPDLWQSNHYKYTPMLWLNQGDGTFVEMLQTVMDRPESSDNPNQGDDYWGDQHGAAWADFDNDGDQDIIVVLGGTGTNEGNGDNNYLLLNEDGRLTDVAEDYDVQYRKASGRGVVWFDYDRDGLLDFYHGAIQRSADSYPSALFRQNPDGHFENVDQAINAPTIASFASTVFLGDITGDGVLDIVTRWLKILDGSTGPRFQEFQNITTTKASSSVLVADFNGDLRQDLYSACAVQPTDMIVSGQLFLNTGNGLVDASYLSGPSSFDFSTRSAVAADFDNDMDVDIFLFNGSTPPDNLAVEQHTALPNVMLWNDGRGAFTADEEIGAQTGPLQGIPLSATASDYDRDGFLDLFLDYSWATDRLIRNDGNGNHWLEIDLKGIVSNREAIGTQVFVTAGGVTQLREQAGGTNRVWSQNDQIIHFGLGQNIRADRIEIRWTNGIVQVLTDVAADQVLTVVEREGTWHRTGTAGHDQIAGTAGDDLLHGGSGNDTLLGGEGHDMLVGDDGNDVLDGQSGDDTFDGGRGADTFWGRGDFDVVDYSLSIPDVIVDIRGGMVGAGGFAEGDAYNGIDGVIGSAGRDMLRGNQGDNHLMGGRGDDTLKGALGNDTLWGGEGADALNGGDGFDFASYSQATGGVRAQLNEKKAGGEAIGDSFVDIEGLIGSRYDDTLVGNGNRNTLHGRNGDDRLWGGKGNDALRGDRGADELHGGDGADTFRIRSTAESNAAGFDTIVDFQTGLDVIHLAKIDADIVQADDQPFRFIGQTAFSGQAGELRFVRDGVGDTWVEGDVDGDAVADLVIRLQGAIDLTAADFLL